MKKTVLPLHIVQIIAYLMCMLLICLGIYVAIWGFSELSLKAIFGGLGTVCLFLYILIYLLHNRIILKDEKIVVTGHWIIKKQGLQFPDEIKYSEIKDVAIICANANSKKKRIRNVGYKGSKAFTYYELTLKDGKTKWIYIECFSKKQRKQILDIINDKAGLNLSYDKLERKVFSFYKRKRKKETENNKKD